VARHADVSEIDPNRRYTGLVHGRDWFWEEILGKRVKIGAGCFLQNNIGGLERILVLLKGFFKDSVQTLGGNQEINVLELFSGLGLYSQFL
jgi:tRNA/tmRNA/rRNA uracil-C5-methylase (TrmA/RlmC/RlmD family)